MRICIYSRYAWSVLDGKSPRHGGAEHTLIRIARELAKTDEVVLVSTSDEQERPATFNNIRVVPVCIGAAGKGKSPAAIRPLLVAGFAARFAATVWRSHADAYLCSLASRDALLVETVARTKRKPFIFRIAHDWETSFPTLRDRIFFGNSRLAEKTVAMLKRAAMIVSQTNLQRESLRSNFGVESVVIPNPHYLSLSVPEYASRKHVLWVGRAGEMKRPMNFLEIARRLAPIPCIMIAPPDENRPDILRDMQQQATGISNLTILPGVPNTELMDYYGRAFAVAITSEAEGLPNVMIEALKCGAPVVSLDVNTDGLLCEGAECLESAKQPPPIGVCACGSMDVMVEAIRHLASDQYLWDQMSLGALAFAKATYDINILVPKYREVIHRAIHSNQG